MELTNNKIKLRLPKYNKHINELDISQMSYAILNNIRIESFRNRFNILCYATVVKSLSPLEKSIFKSQTRGLYGFFGGYDSNPYYKSLKFIIKWRLINYWKSSRINGGKL
ncbi:MAG: hypothetical protein AB7V50_03110 [Vampirovibrionia bacterium]